MRDAGREFLGGNDEDKTFENCSKLAGKSPATSPQKLLIFHVGNDGGSLLGHSSKKLGEFLIGALEKEANKISRGHGNTEMMDATHFVENLYSFTETGLKLHLHHLETGQTCPKMAGGAVSENPSRGENTEMACHLAELPQARGGRH